MTTDAGKCAQFARAHGYGLGHWRFNDDGTAEFAIVDFDPVAIVGRLGRRRARLHELLAAQIVRLVPSGLNNRLIWDADQAVSNRDAGTLNDLVVTANSELAFMGHTAQQFSGARSLTYAKAATLAAYTVRNKPRSRGPDQGAPSVLTLVRLGQPAPGKTIRFMEIGIILDPGAGGLVTITRAEDNLRIHRERFRTRNDAAAALAALTARRRREGWAIDGAVHEPWTPRHEQTLLQLGLTRGLSSTNAWATTAIFQ